HAHAGPGPCRVVARGGIVTYKAWQSAFRCRSLRPSRAARSGRSGTAPSRGDAAAVAVEIELSFPGRVASHPNPFRAATFPCSASGEREGCWQSEGGADAPVAPL